MKNLNQILEKHGIETLSLKEVKEIIAEKAVSVFEAYCEVDESNCSPTVTAIWLETEEVLKFLKETDFHNEEDSSSYDFEILTDQKIVDTTNAYLFFVGDDIQQFFLFSW